MAVTIPILPDAATEITLRSSATDQTPYLGGPVQRISRMGDKWSYKIDCRPMYPRQALELIARLNQGLSEKVIMTVTQPGLSLAAFSDGTVSGAASGRSLNHAGGGATKFVGQFFSVIKNGVRYLHQITAVSGANLQFLPMLKVPLTGGETLEFGAPKIEGFLNGKTNSWTVSIASAVGVSFTIDEAQ